MLVRAALGGSSLAAVAVGAVTAEPAVAAAAARLASGGPLSVAGEEAREDGSEEGLAVLGKAEALLAGGDDGRLHLLLPRGERGEAGVADICTLVLGRAEQQLFHRVPVGPRRVVAKPEDTLRAQGLRTQPYSGGAKLAEPAEHPRAGSRVHRLREGRMLCPLEIRRGQLEEVALELDELGSKLAHHRDDLPRASIEGDQFRSVHPDVEWLVHEEPRSFAVAANLHISASMRKVLFGHTKTGSSGRGSRSWSSRRDGVGIAEVEPRPSSSIALEEPSGRAWT